MDQTEMTTMFINGVNELITNKVIKNQSELAAKLEWSASTMSEVMSGKRPVPVKIFHAFTALRGNLEYEYEKQLMMEQNRNHRRGYFKEMVQSLLARNISLGHIGEAIGMTTDELSKALSGDFNIPGALVLRLEGVVEMTNKKFQAERERELEVLKTAISDVFYKLSDIDELNRKAISRIAELKYLFNKHKDDPAYTEIIKRTEYLNEDLITVVLKNQIARDTLRATIDRLITRSPYFNPGIASARPDKIEFYLSREIDTKPDTPREKGSTNTDNSNLFEID